MEISSLSDDCGSPFKFLSFSYILKDHPKSDLICRPLTSKIMQREKKKDPNTEEIKSDDDGEVYRRPVGRKSWKAMDNKSAIELKELKVAEASLDDQKHLSQLMRVQQELLLLRSRNIRPISQ